MEKTMILCENRHSIPEAVDGAIFPYEIDPTDLCWMAKVVEKRLKNVTRLTLYVTGLSVALVEVIKHCKSYNIGLVLMHYDRVKNNYYPQRAVIPLPPCDFCGKPWNPLDEYCPHCGSH